MDPRTYASRKQRTQLTGELKGFAFEQSPLFQENIIQTMEISQAFEFIEPVPEYARTPGMLDFDQTRIRLGFFATRFSNAGEAGPPTYSFEVVTQATRLIHPRQLDIGDEAWRELWKEYMDDDIESAALDHLDDGDLSQKDLRLGELLGIKEDVIECLIEAGAECELYQRSSLSFATCEHSIESSYERGVRVEGKDIESIGTHDYNDDGWEVQDTPDGQLYIPPKYAPDELPIGDEIETRTQFIELIRAYQTDKEAAENGLLPHDHKLREMRYVLECLRKRRIDLV